MTVDSTYLCAIINKDIGSCVGRKLVLKKGEKEVQSQGLGVLEVGTEECRVHIRTVTPVGLTEMRLLNKNQKNQVTEEGVFQPDRTPGAKALGGSTPCGWHCRKEASVAEDSDQDKDRKQEMRTEEGEVEGRWFDPASHFKVTDVCPGRKGSHCKTLSRGRVI